MEKPKNLTFSEPTTPRSFTAGAIRFTECKAIKENGEKLNAVKISCIVNYKSKELKISLAKAYAESLKKHLLIATDEIIENDVLYLITSGMQSYSFLDYISEVFEKL
jgi:hypothetical protein